MQYNSVFHFLLETEDFRENFFKADLFSTKVLEAKTGQRKNTGRCRYVITIAYNLISNLLK